MATLGAPSTKHFPAVFRCHSGAEAVRILALSLVGLIRPFHLDSSFLILALQCTESSSDIQAKPPCRRTAQILCFSPPRITRIVIFPLAFGPHQYYNNPPTRGRFCVLTRCGYFSSPVWVLLVACFPVVLVVWDCLLITDSTAFLEQGYQCFFVFP